MLYTQAEPDFEQEFWQNMKPLTDSRNLSNPAQTVFFALKGGHRDGHEFIEDLYAKGVRKFVVSKQIHLKDGYVFQVGDPVFTLQRWAAHHRAKLNFPMLAITGSNGKTIVKEWLYELLSPNFSIIKSPKSYNSQIGVPLSVLEAEPGHELGIFEAGISQPGEMQHLAAILRPDYGIFTNIGTAHSENFADNRQKTAEKMSLFKGVKTLIVCAQHTTVVEEARKQNIPVLLWGRAQEAYIAVEEQKPLGTATRLILREKNQRHELMLPFSDLPSIENAMHCIAASRLLGVDYQTIKERIGLLRNLPMRLSIKDGGNCILIDDTYNNDLQGLKVALEFLNQKAGTKPKHLIVSQVTGCSAWEVAALVSQAKLNSVVAVGEGFESLSSHDFGCSHYFFPTTDELKRHLPAFDGFVLIKGSRHFGFEQVVRAYEAKLHSTRLELNLSALAHNFRVFRGILPQNVRIMVMVKAFAYGSGSVEVAKVLEYLGVDYLAVAFVDEGVALRKAGVRVPIMVMSTQSEQLEAVDRFGLEPEVFNLELLRAIALKYPQIPFHIKLNTGMNRLGFDEIGTLKQFIAQHPHLQIKSIFSHLAASGNDLHKDFTLEQIRLYQSYLQELSLCKHVLRHIANTEAIAAYPQAVFDMVRLGIGLYGISENPHIQSLLKVVGTLKTTIIELRNIKAGQSVGYNRAFVAARDCQIAVIAIGYADGFDRRNSLGVGKVLIKNKLVPIVGYVCMDMSFADVTGLDAVAGDEVVVFGENPHVTDIAKNWQTIPYEVLTHVNERVKRIYYED